MAASYTLTKVEEVEETEEAVNGNAVMKLERNSSTKIKRPTTIPIEAIMGESEDGEHDEHSERNPHMVFLLAARVREYQIILSVFDVAYLW